MTETYVGVAGDWHGNTAHALASLRQFHELGISLIFQLGDFGLWGSLLENSHEKFRWRISRTLEQLDQRLFVTLGNHEKYPLLKDFSVTEGAPWPGFLYERKAPRILYFHRGQSLRLRERTFLSLGGASSIDYKYRVEGISLWKQEESISRRDIERTLEEFQRMATVDIFLAHDVFSSAPIHEVFTSDPRWDSEERAYAQASRDALERVARIVQPKLWLHGHYHHPMETTVFWPSGARTLTVGLDQDGREYSTAVLEISKLRFDFLPRPR